VPNGPAGTSDRTARDLQRLLQKYRLVQTPIIVINRPGGSGTMALNQLHAATGDPHTLLLMNGAIVAAHILGLTPYRHSEFTPIASVAEEYFGMNVRAESPIRTAHAMLERLRKQPSALAFGTISVSGINYLSMVMAMKLGGVEYRKLKTVTFVSGSESTLALLGGHIDAVNTGLGNMAEHLKAGKIRTLAIGSPRRMPEPFSDVPTWRELNINVVASGWRGVMGARGLTPAQVKFWETALRRVMETPEWKQDLADNYWISNAMDAHEARKRWDAEYLESQSLLTDLGIARAK
jgi:putative tricarboxylic transport membrane protein